MNTVADLVCYCFGCHPSFLAVFSSFGSLGFAVCVNEFAFGGIVSSCYCCAVIDCSFEFASVGDGGGNNIGSNVYGGAVQKTKLHSLTDYTCWLVIVTHCTIHHT